MIATITKDFTFAAAHHLRGLAEDHKCGRQHGHGYVVRVELTGTVSEVGFVTDYADLSKFGAWLDNTLDHQDLNTIVTFNPTSEHLARWLCGVVREKIPDNNNLTAVAVSISETPKTWCRYEEKW